MTDRPYEHDSSEVLNGILSDPIIGEPAKRRVREELALRRRVAKGRQLSASDDVTPTDAVGAGDASVEGPVSITLPWDVLVSVNERTNPTSGFALTSKYRKALKRARELVGAQWTGPCIDGPVSVRMDFYPPSKRGDVPNLFKLILDSMEGVVYGDDKQANAKGSWRWCYIDKESPRVEVVVEAMEAESAA